MIVPPKHKDRFGQDSIRIADALIQPSDSAKGLGFWMLKSKTGARLCFTILGTSEQFNRLSLELLVKSDHITPILRSLHWPPVKYPIDFKIIILTFKILHGHAPDYLCSMIKRQVNSRCLRSSSKVLLFVP